MIETAVRGTPEESDIKNKCDKQVNLTNYTKVSAQHREAFMEAWHEYFHG